MSNKAEVEQPSKGLIGRLIAPAIIIAALVAFFALGLQ